MYDYEVIVKGDSVEVWQTGPTSRNKSLVAEVVQDSRLAEISQEFYEILAETNNSVCFVREGSV